MFLVPEMTKQAKLRLVSLLNTIEGNKSEIFSGKKNKEQQQ